MILFIFFYGMFLGYLREANFDFFVSMFLGTAVGTFITSYLFASYT
jgi:hypothetical protein